MHFGSIDKYSGLRETPRAIGFTSTQRDGQSSRLGGGGKKHLRTSTVHEDRSKKSV